jgi:uncharacterized protein (DUF433 family)
MKFTPEQIQKIIDAHNQGQTIKSLVEQYKCSRVTINTILSEAENDTIFNRLYASLREDELETDWMSQKVWF